MALALSGQYWTSCAGGCPIFTWIAFLNHVKNVLKVHIRNAMEPMHQPLNMRYTAHAVSSGLKQTGEENLHFVGAAKCSDFFEASGIERGCRRVISMRSCLAVFRNEGKLLSFLLHMQRQASRCTLVALQQVLLLNATRNLRHRIGPLYLEQSRCQLRLLRHIG